MASRAAGPRGGLPLPARSPGPAESRCLPRPVPSPGYEKGSERYERGEVGKWVAPRSRPDLLRAESSERRALRHGQRDVGRDVPCTARKCSMCSQAECLLRLRRGPEVLSVKPGPEANRCRSGHTGLHPHPRGSAIGLAPPVVSLGRGRADWPGFWQKQVVTYKLVKINIMTSIVKNNVREENILEDIIYITP
ncbi:hypothetical protein DUI87_00736 [Hirundo rustica rustica]|uniref:Uncharacterized protein n=1 Tax=Hirundo rustica rustica TaxID=333673 RepID=A0A3M0LA01_HIRRU|nr:hypothetical protein DUI87_00736 [Hirundo rustica rustica]